MQILVIRHATAEERSAGDDESRQLIDEGRAEARATAKALRAMGVKLDWILTSPLARAVQTAETLAKVFRDAKVEQEPTLAPGGVLSTLDARLAELAGQGAAAVAIVGHSPDLNEYIAHLLTGKEQIQVALSKAGAACVEVGENWPKSPGELRWLLRKDHLAAVAKKA